MKKIDSYKYCFHIWFVVIVLLMTAQLADGLEPATRSDEVQKLLRFVPESTVSVFCVDAPFKLRRWDDLTQASVFESAICFTTMLVQHKTQLNLREQRVRCAISAIRNIRDPKRSPDKPILDGPFQSQRCELFLIPEKLPPDWLNAMANKFKAKFVEIAGHKILEIPSTEERFLVVKLNDNVICVANHPGFLSEVLRLANMEGRQRPSSIEKNPIFQTAMSCISPSAKFWGVRLFGQEDEEKDPTSIHNVHSYGGIHDPKAVFVALELSKVESLNVQFYYASEDSIAASKLFPEYLENAVKVTRVREPLTISQDNNKPKYVVTSTMAELSKWKIAGMAEPGVLFLAFCTIFGQGMLL